MTESEHNLQMPSQEDPNIPDTRSARRAEFAQLTAAALEAILPRCICDCVSAEQTAEIARDYASMALRAIDEQERKGFSTLPAAITKRAGPLRKPVRSHLRSHKRGKCA